MNQTVTRRCFIGGLTAAAGTMAWGGARAGAPDLRVGIFSDHHLGSLGGGGVDLASRPAQILERTLRFYKERNVDAILIAGDFCHQGRVAELKATSDVWAKVFGGIKEGPVKIFVTGNHEKVYFDQTKGKKDFENPIYKDGLYRDVEKNWMDLFGEKWEPFFIKKVKGYSFVGAHWGEWWKDKGRPLREFLAAHKAELDPSKPFFYTQHAHPQNTCYGPWTWHQWEGGPTDQILAEYPNAVAFSGHTHYSITDERSVWQGAFTSIGTASLLELAMPNGRENGEWARGKPRRMRGMYDGWDSEGLLMDVWGDEMVFERWDFLNMEKIGDDWVVPVMHKHEDNPAYSFENRRAKAAAPEFPEGAKLATSERYWWHLSKEKEDQVLLTSPLATGTDSLSRCFEYEVRAVFAEDDVERTMCTKRFFQPECHLNAKRLPEKFDAVIGLAELPTTPFTFVVTPMNSFGVRGKPLTLDYRQPEYRKPPEKRLSQMTEEERKKIEEEKKKGKDKK